MSIRFVLFDLDGTLLPMDQEVFVRAYVKGLAEKLAPLGFVPEQVIQGLWAGTGAMIQNDGSLRNEEVFWKTFCGIVGENILEYQDLIDSYYRNEFQAVQQVCGFAPQAAQVIASLRDRGFQVILATNPLFPRVATESRVRWAGLEPEDFRLITVYENSCHCKPNPAYYQDVLREIGAKPEECVMVGNDAKEDMVALELGMKGFLLTDCLINSEGRAIDHIPQGNFSDLREFLEQL